MDVNRFKPSKEDIRKIIVRIVELKEKYSYLHLTQISQRLQINYSTLMSWVRLYATKEERLILKIKSNLYSENKGKK
jgi:hypothetical protein